MQIYILEDQPYHQQRLRDCLSQLSDRLNLPLSFAAVTADPDELLDQISACGRDQVYFLDIALKDDPKRGFAVAQAIRRRDEWATIIFVTTHSEFAAITYHYKVAALDFIDKELETEDFLRALESNLQHVDSLNRTSDREDVFELKVPHRHIRIPFQEIYYIETSQVAHKLTLLSDRHRVEFYASMRQIEAAEPRLFRAHKAYLINPGRVTEINRSERLVYFTNGQSCLISRRKMRELEDLLSQSMAWSWSV